MDHMIFIYSLFISFIVSIGISSHNFVLPYEDEIPGAFSAMPAAKASRRNHQPSTKRRHQSHGGPSTATRGITPQSCSPTTTIDVCTMERWSCTRAPISRIKSMTSPKRCPA